jgi:ubiquinone/menaquinone biosynthesis C-methylase UbiE
MKKSLDHFGILAPFYERFITPRYPEKLFSLARLNLGCNVLDIGGGTGRVAGFLIGKVSKIIIGDESFHMLEEARKKVPLIPICGKSEEAPFRMESFYRIIMVDALHHVQNQEKTVLELLRLLKTGGRIVIEEPDIRKPSIKVVAFLEKLALMRSHFLKSNQIAAFFRFTPAIIDIQSEEHTTWVVIEKPSTGVD